MYAAMGKLLRLPLILNKKNGQISTYVRREQLPQSVLDALKEQPSATRRLLMEFRGVEND